MAKRTLTMDREGAGDLNDSENAGKCRRKTPHAPASAENGILDGGAWRRMAARGSGFDGGVTGVWTVGGFRAQWSGACPEIMAGDDWV